MRIPIVWESVLSMRNGNQSLFNIKEKSKMHLFWENYKQYLMSKKINSP